MNIRNHIEAGHYPKDDHGMEMVQTSCGSQVKIADVHPAASLLSTHAGG